MLRPIAHPGRGSLEGMPGGAPLHALRGRLGVGAADKRGNTGIHECCRADTLASSVGGPPWGLIESSLGKLPAGHDSVDHPELTGLLGVDESSKTALR